MKFIGILKNPLLGSLTDGNNFEKPTTIEFNYRPVETYVFKFENQNKMNGGVLRFKVE